MSRHTDTRDPEHPAKPDSLTDVEKPSWKHVLKRTFREFSRDQSPDLAAGLTYYAVLSAFPGLLAVFSLLGVIGQGQQAADAVLDIVGQVAPGGTAETLRGPIEELASSPTAGFALISGIVLALWSASGYVGAFSRALNRIWEIDEGRPFYKLKPQQLGVTVLAVALVVVALVLLVVSGPVAQAIGDAIGLGDTAVLIWQIAKWPVLALIIVLLVAVLYYFGPNAKQPKFRWISSGALIAIAVLAIATLGFGLYVANFSNYERTYGSFAGVIIFLLWLWITNLALLFGAEFDAELERGRELQAGMPAEETIQLPPRDTKRIEKTEKQEAEEREEARNLRQSRGRSDS
ncbi:YihY/virulence factor BrkB family protein [Microbacterium thalli]|uniref:YihY/virulence factor BrkB family protein n=1 Tax=Microbacterium thalli TaxID=3027921 RepID=A0ABT5SK11_9MICO|nr:YihY/virulence factor BrkB family protein [Microbacterium thalli]MDD7963175.1 YihY/virulence factor BrkB family protein [Microbacterium thalli]MDN8548127.1 YihY/virulence factor BrkB family protein [Microbacterium thalli]